MKRTFSLILTLIMMILCCSCSSSSVGQINIVCFSIGKADCFLISQGDANMLIDTSESDTADDIVSYLDDNGITSLDYLILSHYDKDHIGGAAKIIKKFDVKNIIASSHIHDGDEYEKYINAMKKKDIQAQKPSHDTEFSLNNLKVKIYTAQSAKYDNKDANNSSLAVDISHGSTSFLFTGDAMDDRIAELMQDNIGAHTFLKVPYHGKYESSYYDFFKAVSPEYAVITSSENEPEDARILNMLSDIGTDVFLTRNGVVTISGNGKTLTVSQ